MRKLLIKLCTAAFVVMMCCANISISAKADSGVFCGASYTYDGATMEIEGNFYPPKSAFNSTMYNMSSPFSDNFSGVSKIVIKNGTLAAHACKALFSNLPYLQEVQFINVDASMVNNMYQMFNYCQNLTTVDISGLQTSGVTDMRRMFAYCPNLRTINMKGTTISGGAMVDEMFEGCRSLQTIIAPSSIGRTVPLGDSFVDGNGTQYTELSSANQGKTLTRGSGNPYTPSQPNPTPSPTPSPTPRPSISTVKITVVEPVWNKRMENTATVGDKTYSVSYVNWNPSSYTFAADTEYTVQIQLAAANGNTFSSGTKFYINNREATVAYRNDNTAIISYKFARTEKATYAITVKSGTAKTNSGATATKVAEGVEIKLSANTPAAGLLFDKWVATGITLSNATQMQTSFTMPARAVTVEATYKPCDHKASKNKSTCTATANCTVCRAVIAKLPHSFNNKGICTVCGHARTVCDIFTDVIENQWYVSYVQYAYDNKIMNGKSATTFGTEDKITRTEFVQVLYNMEGKPQVTFNNKFKDISSKDWFANAVTWANQNDIANGYEDGRFGANDKITREQMALMLYKYAKLKKYKTSPISSSTALLKFSDSAAVSSWAEDAIKWAVVEGVMSGKPKDGKTVLDPRGFATRAECATMIKNMIEKCTK